MMISSSTVAVGRVEKTKEALHDGGMNGRGRRPDSVQSCLDLPASSQVTEKIAHIPTTLTVV